MHICIPDTRQMRPAHGSAYLLYNVHIDGLYHCSLRFKQLLHLHQSLSKKFSTPQFPPKKLLPLSVNQVEDRRQQLEKYLQNISQDKTISNSSIFNLFLLEAQRESTRIEEKHVHLDIELVNGQKIRLPLVTHDSADSVLTSVCRALNLDDRYHAYFCLCLCGYDVVRDKLIIKRKLSFFEAPFITLQMAIQQQEQLQSVLSASSSNPVSGRVGMNGSNAAINNNLDLNCSCLNCSQRDLQQATSVTNEVPHTSFSTSTDNTNLLNLEQASFNGDDLSNYYRASNGNYSSNGNRHQYSTDSWSALATNRSFVTHRILLRKSYWDPVYDSYILSDQQALNLLFIQTVYDMKHSLMFVDRDTYHQLETLLTNDSKLEYILLARTVKYYNYVHFEPCYSNYPRPRTKVMISIGCKELNMRVLKTPRTSTPSQQANLMQRTSSSSSSAQETSQISSNGNEVCEKPVLYCTSSLVPSGYRDLITKDDLIEEEYNFKVPLIRCWRLTSLETLNSNNNCPQQSHNQNQARPTTTAIAGGKRKSFSLFNSVVGNLSGSNDSQMRPSIRTNHPTSNIVTPAMSSGANDSRFSNIIGSGTNGQSLISALMSTSERNNDSSILTSNGHSFPRFSSDIGGHSENAHHSQFCPCENSPHQAEDEIDQTQLSQYELSFEYLVARDKLKWITISSDQAIFISISLQGVVDELVSKRDSILVSSEVNNPLASVPATSHGSHPSTRSTSIASTNSSTPPISIMAPRNSSLSNQRQKLSESFTYLYRDGAQKLLRTHSIERLCSAPPASFTHHPPHSASRRISGALSTAGCPLTQSAPTSSRIAQASFWGTDSRGLATSPSRYLFGYSQATSSHPHQSTFELANNVKKAPSPIINDAFEGVTNGDDI